ncbi:Uncharacterised protein [Brucella anthropi]|nr:Uncharacterised protein [Brucella anthropi]
MRQRRQTRVSFQHLLDISTFVTVDLAADSVEHFALYGCVNTPHGITRIVTE